jgi:hypothetical protein
MTNRENQNNVALFFKAVESNVARPAAGYDQFAQFVLDRAAKQGMASKHGDSLFNEVDGFRRGERITSFPDLGKRSLRVDQPRHDLAFGIVDFLPATRALR